ncbi:ExbD/TolR family protein, partial [candidate division KSB1 bacterium]
AIQIRNKRNPNFSTASMSDLVFLLLIFFMLTSTLVSPNAVKLLLPDSNSRTIAKQTITIELNDSFEYYLDGKPITLLTLTPMLNERLKGQAEATVVLRADKSVPLQFVVNIIDVVNNVNKMQNAKHKVILATSPKK